VEWSVNEKVALEVAAAGSYSGMRSLCAMKQNGLNVASDFLLNVNLIGIKAGLVLVVCDDPAAHSSNNEQDSRLFARMADLPLLEPSTFQEAKEMTRFAFDLSEELGIVCLLRGVTRTSHARGNVLLGKLPPINPKKAHFDTTKPWRSQPIAEKHNRLHQYLTYLQEPVPLTLPRTAALNCSSSRRNWLADSRGLEFTPEDRGNSKSGRAAPARKFLIKNLAKTDRVLFSRSTFRRNVKSLRRSARNRPKKSSGKSPIPVFGK
jgi:indolepyruvate ferredoxin oxidoreductase alpha subunit